MIYADNAATTKLDINVFEAMKPYLLEEYGNASQPYSFSRSAKAAIKNARQTVALCINAKPDEIYFTSGGTESDNWAIKGSAFSDADYKTTITSQIEHHAVLNACVTIKRLRYPVVYLRAIKDGVITPTELESVINNRTRLVSVMLVNNEIGTIQPVKELCSIAHAHGAVFHTDAVQALGHIPVDVHELGVDMLSASAHKFNGPKGIGFLYIRKGTIIVPYADGGAQEFGFRAGTENVASIVGMATALKANCEKLDKNTAQIKGLERLLIEKLNDASIQFVRNGGNNTLPGLLSLSFTGAEGEAILHRMDLLGISISTGSACDSMHTEISHVLQAIRLDKTLANRTIRISLGKNNTVEDVEAIATALKKIECDR
ncbi:MAG: cysteine desulfurase family protein [Oscillospiraceae bacterium]|nr:cysteine desulfurase family protein [Oscillospiraceae bacterium]